MDDMLTSQWLSNPLAERNHATNIEIVSEIQMTFGGIFHFVFLATSRSAIVIFSCSIGTSVDLTHI